MDVEYNLSVSLSSYLKQLFVFLFIEGVLYTIPTYPGVGYSVEIGSTLGFFDSWPLDLFGSQHANLLVSYSMSHERKIFEFNSRSYTIGQV